MIANLKNNATRGFTLLEMIVSVGLFALVMLIATGAYFTLIALDRQARATNEVVNNLSFAVDTMTRGIRTGTNYKCLSGADPYGNSTSGNCTSFSYTDTNLGMTVTYLLESNGTIGRCDNPSLPCNETTASKLTDPSITLSNTPGSLGLVFYVRGVGTSTGTILDNQQPQVLFTIKGTMPGDSKGTLVPFVIEEDATQRLIEI